VNQADEPKLDLRLVPAALTAWLVTATGIVWEVGWALTAACSLTAVIALTTWMFCRRSARSMIRSAGLGVTGAAVVGAGFSVAVALRCESIQHHPIAQRFGDVGWVTVSPTESPRSLVSGRVMFQGNLIRLGHFEIAGRVVVFAPAAGYGTLLPGQPARFRARLARPMRRDLTVATLTATGEPALGEAAPVQRAAHAVRARFGALARDVLPAEQAAMVSGLVLGDTSTVLPATLAEFRVAGLTHLTAVSGANVTIVCGAMLLSSVLVGPRIAVALAAIALVAFVVVVQPTPSVLRAAVMGAIGLLAVLSSRRRQAVPVLAATVITLMVVMPQLSVDIGFALSVTATAALVVVAPRWSRRMVARGCPKPLADAVCVAFAAQLVTAPLIAVISGRFSLVAVVANVVVAPVIAPVTVLGTAAAALCLFLPAVAGLLIRFTGPEVWWLLRVADTAAALPAADVPVPSGAAGFLTIAGVGAAVVVLIYRPWHDSRRERRGRPAFDPRRRGAVGRACRRQDPAVGAEDSGHR